MADCQHPKMTSPLDSDNAKDQDKYVMRFPEGMRDSIKAAAKSNNRSLNAEIIARLQATLDESHLSWREEDIDKLAQRIAQKLVEMTRG